MNGGTITGLDDRIDDIVAGIDRDAIDRNFERWDILGANVWPNSFVGDTYEGIGLSQGLDDQQGGVDE